MTRTISAMAFAASASSRRVDSDELQRWRLSRLVSCIWARMASAAPSCARAARSARGFPEPCSPRRGHCRSRCQAHGWCRHSGPDWERCAPPIRLCLLGGPKPGRHQAVKAEAAKRGRDSVSLYGMRPVRFTAVSSKRTCRRTVWQKAGNHRAHRTSSNSPFGRHPTGSAIHRLMSDSCQPVPLVLILS